MSISEIAAVPPPPFVVAAWNIERGRRHWEIRERLHAENVAVALLTECDIGMARSGNVNTVSVIAAGRYGYAFGLEFQEQGLGNRREQQEFAGQANMEAQHGNAVLSRFPIVNAARIELTNGNEWPRSDQPRDGGRVVVIAAVEWPSGPPLWFASAHLESRTTPEKRAKQMRRIMIGLGKFGAARCVLGGDFNTKESDEPLFAVAEEFGFGWREANCDTGRFAGRRLDWLFCRGVEFRHPQTVDAAGISDHDLITLEIAA